MKVRLSQKQKKRLKKIYKSDKDNRASARAHMVILYYVEGYTMEEIAKICQCDRKTVSSAIKCFEEERFDGLYDNPRSGSPRKLSEEDEKYIFESLEKSPMEYNYHCTVWTLNLMIYHLYRMRNKAISVSTLRDILHKHRWHFNRPKHIPPTAEPIDGKEREEILRLLVNPGEDEVLLFSDESDLELLPYITGMWMPEGKQFPVPTPGKNQCLCIFGFFNPHNKDFMYKTVRSRKNKTAKNFIAALHQIRQDFRGKKIHIVVDHASIHDERNKLLKKFQEIYSEEVIIHFLPKRATILNPIERFWQFIKKRIASNWLYESLDELKAAFRCFIWQYREGNIDYNFSLIKLIQLWQKYPTIEEVQLQLQNVDAVLNNVA